MRKKRERHDRVVEKYKSKEPCEENVSLFQKNMYTVQNEFFKNENTKRENLNQNFDQYDENGEENGLDHDNDDMLSDSDERAVYKNFDDQDLVIKITNNGEENDTNDKSVKRKSRGKLNGVSKKVAKRNNLQIIDVEHFIPYKPKNAEQEKAYEFVYFYICRNYIFFEKKLFSSYPFKSASNLEGNHAK